MKTWICDGVPKNGKDYPMAPDGGHEPYENTGPDCLICGLPKEAMESVKTAEVSQKNPNKVGKTVIAGSRPSQSLLPLVIIGLIILLMGGGIAAFLLLRNNSDSASDSSSPTQSSLISANVTNPQLLSQGEKILLQGTPDKQAGASAFTQEDWNGAIAAYTQAVQNDPNDPESRIYLNNAKAQQAGSPLTIAVAVPISSSADSAKEVLRGVARYQEDMNTAANKLLQVVIADSGDPLQASSLAEDLVNTPSVLGVLGHGADPGSQQALRRYETAQLAALSPLTTSVTTTGQPTLTLIPLDQKADELLSNYLQGVGKTLTTYAQQQRSPLSAVIFYNSDSSYSQQLKQQTADAISASGGKLIQEIDVTGADFNPETAITTAQEQGATTAFLALSKNKVEPAIDLAQANQTQGSPLLLMGGDELYNPDILVQGGNAIEGLILAVPWSFQPGDPFAQDAIASWKGRVSWRTATAYDATQVLADTVSQNLSRAAVYQALTQGISIKSRATNFNIFNDVPLVEAVKGSNGPPGSNYQFSALP